MEAMIAYCGLACNECGAYIATLNDDNEKRKEVAKQWSEEYGSDFKPEAINCVGCIVDSENVFGYCKKCEIRKCGMSKKISNCAYCDDYACAKLTKFFEMAPDAKKRLDRIRSHL
jgi:hypothetical protein